MTLHIDLLEQAAHLARREPKRPRQASLRRAVSAAYYALFHMLVSESGLKLIPNKPDGLRLQAGRAFSHRDMKDACDKFARKLVMNENHQNNLLHLLQAPLEAELISIAAAFIDLQQARHSADYDLSNTFDRVGVLQKVDLARQAIADWKKIRAKANANVFVAALLLQRNWNK